MNTPPEITIQYTLCPLGCIQDDKTILTGRDLIHNLPGDFNIVQCRSCGLIRTNPRPTPETIDFYYPDDYGPYLGTRVQQESLEDLKWTFKFKSHLKKILRKIFNSNSTLVPQLPPGRMLEIGCASGTFMHQMAKKGWQVSGIEFSSKAAQATAALGYPVYVGPLETAPEFNESFDLIVGWMALEHLHSPVAGLQKLRNWAKPNTWLVLSMPNAGSLEFRLFKKRWYALQLPNHLYHYTPNTISRILNHSGWKPEKIFHHKTLINLLVSTGYLLCDKGHTHIGKKLINSPEKSGIWNCILYPLAWILSYFGQTGRMTIWARVSE